MTREDKRAYNYARDRLANDDYPVYSDEYELELAYKAGIEDARNHPHWISVDDELPPCNVFVLTCDKQENTNLLMLAGDGRWYDKAVGLHRNITHWMYLPQAPKKGGEE